MKTLLLMTLLSLVSENHSDDILEKVKLSEHTKAITDAFILDLDSTFSFSTQTREGDSFGYALSTGDYDGDGFQDLAIGIPSFDINLFGFIVENVGAVLVNFGSSSGLDTRSELLFQRTVQQADDIEEGDLFGRVLTTGDFDNDGFDDLAVGVPFEDVFSLSPVFNAGAVNIFYGASTGFGETSTLIHAGIGSQSESNVEANDQFGTALQAGDFNDDGFDDLVVGVPLEDFGLDNQINNVGQILIYYGSVNGAEIDGREALSQNTFQVLENSEAGDLFGWSLAVGDFDNDGIDDLAVGVPGEDVAGENSAGIVQIFNGSIVSGVSVNDYIRSQDGPVNGIPEAFDEFGHSLASGDINNDGISDLVIGVWKEDANSSGLIDSGGINVLYGSNGSLSQNGDQFISQSNVSVQGTGANTDQFGETVYVADLNYDGFDDVIVGSPNDIGFDSNANVDNAGGINILLGSASGVSLSGDEYRPAMNLNDRYGHALTVGFFGELVQLVVGVPGWLSDDGDVDSGAVEIIDFTLPDLIFKNSFGGPVI